MKFRPLLLSLALFALCAAPMSFAQDSGSSKPSDTPTASAPDSTTPSTDKTDKTEADKTDKDDKDKDKAGDDASTKPPDPNIEPADPSKVKHDGGKDDVDAIGNRKIGGRGLGNWYSVESEIRMGKSYAQQVESGSKVITDPVIAEYVNRIGQNIVRNSDAQVPFTIKVIDSDEINAFALPGGFFYVYTGLILAADEEAELAGVMAHEIAHVAARHATRQLTRSQYANIGTLPLIFMGGGVGYAVRAAAGFGLPVTFLKFQRGFEAEADYLGLQYMYKSGYDPSAFISFFEKIQAQEKRKPGSLAKAFSSHPQTPDRIEASQKEIATILPAKPQYLVTTSEFDEVKARLAALENRRKMVDDKDSKKPSLRRTSNPDKTDGKDGKTDSGDDRPTLKRRPD
jgi:beta-barrel assembly-enhancing protease